jgi:hypothetical protein
MPPDNLGHDIRETVVWNAVCILVASTRGLLPLRQFYAEKRRETRAVQGLPRFFELANGDAEHRVGLYSCLKSRPCVAIDRRPSQKCFGEISNDRQLGHIVKDP